MRNLEARGLRGRKPAVGTSADIGVPQAEPEALLDPGTQRFPVHSMAVRPTSRGAWLSTVPTPAVGSRSDVEGGRCPSTSPARPSFLETSNPICHRPRSIAKQRLPVLGEYRGVPSKFKLSLLAISRSYLDERGAAKRECYADHGLH